MVAVILTYARRAFPPVPGSAKKEKKQPLGAEESTRRVHGEEIKAEIEPW
jgi:hypothetical protein